MSALQSGSKQGNSSGPIALAVLALVAAGCGEAALDDPFDAIGELEQGLALDCTGASVCTGTAPAYAAAYRIGHTPTSRGELLQTFEATTGTAPTRVTIIARKLRAFTLLPGEPQPQVHVAIYDPTNPASPDTSGSPLASAAVDVSALGAAGTDFTFTGAPALVAGHTYALAVWTDDLAQGNPSSLLVGVGALSTSTYADGAAFRRGRRRTADAAPEVGWAVTRFQPAGQWQVALALESAPEAGPAPGATGWYRGDSYDGSSWQDLSGHGRHLTGGGAMPTLVASDPAFNGKPVVNFNGSQHIYSSVSWASLIGANPASNLTVYIVGRMGGHNMAVLSSHFNGLIFQTGFSYNGYRFSDNVNWGPAAGPPSNPCATLNVPVIWRARMQAGVATYSKVTSCADDSGPGSPGVNTINNANVDVGYIPGGGGYVHLNGRLAEIITYASFLAPADLATTEAYLFARYGLSW